MNKRQRKKARLHELAKQIYDALFGEKATVPGYRPRPGLNRRIKFRRAMDRAARVRSSYG